MNTLAPQILAVTISHSPALAQDTRGLQGAEFRRGLTEVIEAVRRYQPTFVLYFGPDHMRALSAVAPCFTVVESAVGYGDWGTSQEPYQIPTERATALADYLAAGDIDIATGRDLRLDHGFGQCMEQLFGSLSAVPMVPVVINCVDRPIATVRRTAALGTAVGDFLRHQLEPDERVLVVGSGGISHSPPTLVPGARNLTEADRQRLLTDNIDRAAEAINPDWDDKFLTRLAGDDWRTLGQLTPEELVGAGTGGAEVRTWIATAFAADAALPRVVYEPVREWITGMGIAASAGLIAS